MLLLFCLYVSGESWWHYKQRTTRWRSSFTVTNSLLPETIHTRPGMRVMEVHIPILHVTSVTPTEYSTCSLYLLNIFCCNGYFMVYSITMVLGCTHIHIYMYITLQYISQIHLSLTLPGHVLLKFYHSNGHNCNVNFFSISHWMHSNCTLVNAYTNVMVMVFLWQLLLCCGCHCVTYVCGLIHCIL